MNESYDHESDRIQALCEIYFVPEERITGRNSLDPFSPEYWGKVVEQVLEITERGVYDPTQSERTPHLEPIADCPILPDAYRSGDSVWLGEMVQSYGGVLKALGARRGQSVLEYGPGYGQIALHLARLGCAVTVVDVEQRYLDRIQAQAADLHVRINTIQALFRTAEPSKTYDRILFYEAFHHALDHHDLLRTLRGQLAPSGSIVFAGEPILEVGNYYRPTLPYA